MDIFYFSLCLLPWESMSPSEALDTAILFTSKLPGHLFFPSTASVRGTGSHTWLVHVAEPDLLVYSAVLLPLSHLPRPMFAFVSFIPASPQALSVAHTVELLQ